MDKKGDRDLLKRLYRHWFLGGLVCLFLITLGDASGMVSEAGKWLKLNHGPDIVIILIFLFSGMALDVEQIKSGITDVSGLFLALALIFVISPLLAYLFGFAPVCKEIKIGIFLVAAMPTTLSSGVIMTGASGGNMAHALMITVLANSLSVFTIPVSLSILLANIGNSGTVEMDKAAIMIKICWSVLVPLFLGLLIKHQARLRIVPFQKRLSMLNQIFVLGIVWMALSQSRQVIVNSGHMAFVIFVAVFLFHGALLAASFSGTKIFGLKPGRRESVILMGGQKTLPLSVILQVSLFPQYGLVLVVCVMHHIIHLIMDGWFIIFLKNAHEPLISS
jgi:solute carrier family 10 (sodium/bile acid cotransporter), member 7